MEEVYNLLKKQKKNTLEGIIQHLKDTKIIDGTKLTEDKAKSFFEGADPKNIELPKLEEVMGQMAEFLKENPEDFKKKFLDEDAMKLLGGGGGILSGFKHKLEDITKETTEKITGLAEKAEAATSQAVNQASNMASSAADDISGVISKNKKKAEDIAKNVTDKFKK